MEQVNAGELITKTLQQDMVSMETTFSTTNDMRMAVAHQLHNTVSTMTIDPNEDRASTMLAKVGVVNALTGLLNDIDKQAKTRVDVKMRQKEQEDNNENHGKLVAAMFAQCLGKDLKFNQPAEGTVVVTDEDVSKKLDELTADGTIIIEDFEKRDDPTDLS